MAVLAIDQSFFGPASLALQLHVKINGLAAPVGCLSHFPPFIRIGNFGNLAITASVKMANLIR